MQPLVVVRWHGEVIATHDQFPLGIEGAPEGVTVEVVDVSAERAGMNLRPAVPVLLLVSLLASVILHAGVGTALVVAANRGGPSGPISSEIMPPQNDESAAVQDPILKVAREEPPPEPPKEKTPEPEPPKPPDPPKADPPPPPEDTALAVEDLPAAPAEPADIETPPPPAEIAPDGQGGTDDFSASPTTCARAPAAANHGPKCKRSVVFTGLQKSPSCYVDTVAHEGQAGVLTFPCSGDGEASLRFGKKTFIGAVVNGKVDVCTGTEYLFSDHCKWTSAQRVTGTVGNGDLRFTYGEAPKPGQQSCAAACGATASIVFGALAH